MSACGRATCLALLSAAVLSAALLNPDAARGNDIANGAASDARSGPDPHLRAVLLEAVAEADSFADRFDAEVWLTDMSQRLARQVPDPEERLHILRTVHRQAARIRVPPELVLAVIDVESNFDRYAISSASALGLMQVMPFWVDELGYDDINILFDIELNILLGSHILRHYLDKENGNLVRALARYNGSLGQVWYPERVLQRWRNRWERY